MLHQGTDIVPVDFIISAKANHNLLGHHEKLISNFLAQSEALAFGKSKDTVINEMLEQGFNYSDALKLSPHRSFKGNRPSTSIIYEKMNPFSLGRLIALYEHKVFVQGVIWGINSFDQWGVELGKELASNLEPVINSDATVSSLDGSTVGLLGYINLWRT